MTRTRKTQSIIKSGIQLLVIFGLLIGVVFLTVNIYRSIQKYRAVNEEIGKLEAEADKFNQENKKLHKLVEYFNSEDFQEKEIKEKLNLVKEGEKVVFVQGDAEDDSKKNNIESKPDIKIEHANYYYWWQYFFGRR